MDPILRMTSFVDYSLIYMGSLYSCWVALLSCYTWEWFTLNVKIIILCYHIPICIHVLRFDDDVNDKIIFFNWNMENHLGLPVQPHCYMALTLAE